MVPSLSRLRFTRFPALGSPLLEEGPTDSEAGPGSPCKGLEWVVRTAAPPYVRPPTLRARSALQASLVGSSSKCRLSANKGEI